MWQIGLHNYEGEHGSLRYAIINWNKHWWRHTNIDDGIQTLMKAYKHWWRHTNIDEGIPTFFMKAYIHWWRHTPLMKAYKHWWRHIVGHLCRMDEKGRRTWGRRQPLDMLFYRWNGKWLWAEIISNVSLLDEVQPTTFSQFVKSSKNRRNLIRLPTLLVSTSKLPLTQCPGTPCGKFFKSMAFHRNFLFLGVNCTQTPSRLVWSKVVSLHQTSSTV